MHREYHKWHSPSLGRDMEILVFGHAGARVLFFPTRRARFFDYENWGVLEPLRTKMEAGLLQVYCVDSIDGESLYNRNIHPGERIKRHSQYEKYIVEEVFPFSREKNPNMFMIVAGCSLGAYHAVNLAFRHPQLVGKVVGMSGRYDLVQPMGVFRDLFNGYVDEDIYYNIPNKYITNLKDRKYLDEFNRMEIVFAIGQDDVFLDDNKFLNHTLWQKGIWSALHIWDGEAHNPDQWKQMVQLYF